jgi:hypothetical protein
LILCEEIPEIRYPNGSLKRPIDDSTTDVTTQFVLVDSIFDFFLLLRIFTRYLVLRVGMEAGCACAESGGA